MKKHLSVLLALVMLITMLPTGLVFADDYLVGAEKAKLELVYMKYNAGVSEGENEDGDWSLIGGSSSAMNCAPASIPSYDEINVGDQILVGVRMSGLSNMKCVENGEKFNSISVVIDYDPDYLTAESTANLRNLTRRRAGFNNQLYKSIDGLRYAVDNDATATQANNVKVAIKYDDGQQPTYPDATKYNDEQYVAIVGFKVKAKPDKETGAKVVSLRGGETAGDSMAFGVTGMGTKYTAGASGNSMADVFEYVSSVDLFPVPKAATPITSVTVPNIDDPTAGADIPTTVNATCDPAAGKASSTIAWKTSAGAAATGKFAANTIYTATITVNAATDHEFADGITVNGTGWSKDASSTKTALVLTKTFPATGKNKLNALNITGLVAPETGKAPMDATKIKVANATVSEVTWDPADNPFKPATAYKVTFKATPADAYELADTLTATANAGTATATKNADGTANVEVTFGKTAAGDIKAVTLTATAPTKNQSPAEPTVSGTEYTVKGTSTWNPAVEGGKFAGEKEYTQTVVLTAADGYKFASSISTATVAGAKAVKATPNADGSELTIEITWPATDGKEVKALELNGPDKTTYKYGETIDLTGLTATITWDDDSVTENIALADFAANGLVCDTETGDSVGNVGTKTVKVNKGNKEATVDLTIEEADVTFTWAGLTQTEGSVNAPTVTVTPVDPAAALPEIKMWDVNATPAAVTGDCTNEDHANDSDHDGTCGATYTPAEAGFVPFDGSKLTVGTTTVQAIYAATANTKAKTEEATLTVNARRSGGGGGGSSMLTVRFDAGVNGKITKGSSTVKVAKNEKLKSSDIPTVTANEGYRFLGWTLDGSKTVDPTKDAVTSSITYRALYNTGATHGVYMRGDSDGNFYPERNITRAEAAALIARLNANYNEGTKYSSSLTDVAAEEWYASAVNFCASSGLITGYDDGTFLPNNQITRQEFCAIVARYLSLNNAGEANFSDIDETIWGAGYISQLAGKGIINGYEDGTFAPNAPIKRCEVVKILNGVFDRTPDASTVNDNIGNYSVRIPDISANHWAYYEILEAAVEHDHADFHKAN